MTTRATPRLYDISRTVSPVLAVWPGDTPYQFSHVLRVDEGASVNLTTLTLRAHTGSHADAPYHYDAQGSHPAELDLHAYLGPAHVVTIERRSGGIVLHQLLAAEPRSRPPRRERLVGPGTARRLHHSGIDGGHAAIGQLLGARLSERFRTRRLQPYSPF